jgi:hypothetical protein
MSINLIMFSWSKNSIAIKHGAKLTENFDFSKDPFSVNCAVKSRLDFLYSNFLLVNFIKRRPHDAVCSGSDHMRHFISFVNNHLKAWPKSVKMLTYLRSRIASCPLGKLQKESSGARWGGSPYSGRRRNLHTGGSWLVFLVGACARAGCLPRVDHVYDGANLPFKEIYNAVLLI